MPNQHGSVSREAKLASGINNLRHGNASTTFFLQNENPDDFCALLENAFEQYKPAFDHDAALVLRAMKDHWLLLRRERTLEVFEAALHDRKSDYRTWFDADLAEMHRFDRYKTDAARAYQRSLKNLQTIQKMARDDERWQLQLASAKQKLALDLEKFELAKKKAQPPEAKPDFPPLPDLPFFGAPTIPGIQQTLYIGFEDDDVTTVIYEVTPSNDQIRRQLSEGDTVVRTYNFVGGVPPEYQHLITPDAITWGASTSVKKTYSFEAWSSLASNE